MTSTVLLPNTSTASFALLGSRTVEVVELEILGSRPVEAVDILGSRTVEAVEVLGSRTGETVEVLGQRRVEAVELDMLGSRKVEAARNPKLLLDRMNVFCSEVLYGLEVARRTREIFREIESTSITHPTIYTYSYNK